MVVCFREFDVYGRMGYAWSKRCRWFDSLGFAAVQGVVLRPGCRLKNGYFEGQKTISGIMFPLF